MNLISGAGHGKMLMLHRFPGEGDAFNRSGLSVKQIPSLPERMKRN